MILASEKESCFWKRNTTEGLFAALSNIYGRAYLRK